VRIHVREQPKEWERFGKFFGVEWTPTVLVVDSTGAERHRIEGSLPVEEFLGQLILGLGHSAFARHEWSEAERLFREAIQRAPKSSAAPEAQYWAGVARYKATNDASALGQTAEAFRTRYSDSPWAKKASVWEAGRKST
jgi:hypothetical protein